MFGQKGKLLSHVTKCVHFVFLVPILFSFYSTPLSSVIANHPNISFHFLLMMPNFMNTLIMQPQLSHKTEIFILVLCFSILSWNIFSS